MLGVLLFFSNQYRLVRRLHEAALVVAKSKRDDETETRRLACEYPRVHVTCFALSFSR